MNPDQVLDQQFWDNEDDLLVSLLFPRILGSAMAGAQSAQRIMIAQVGLGVDWGAVNNDVATWARRHSGELIKGINDTTRGQVRDAIANWIGSGRAMPALEAEIGSLLGPTRAELIASTEVTRAFARGNRAVWKQSGIVTGKRWQTAVDERVCPTCGPLHGQVAPLEGTFDGVDDPPRHPRCQCWITPVLMEIP